MPGPIKLISIKTVTGLTKTNCVIYSYAGRNVSLPYSLTFISLHFKFCADTEENDMKREIYKCV